MQLRIVQNHAQAPLLCQRQHDFYDVRFVEVVGEHLERKARIVEHLVEHGKNLLARGLAHPAVDLRKGDRLSVVGAGLRAGVEFKVLGLGDDRRARPEMMDIGSRLHVSPGESERDRAFLERPNGRFHRGAQAGVQRLHGPGGVEVARSHRVGVIPKRRRNPLMGRARIMGPAVFLDGSIRGGVGLLACDLLVFAGIFKLKIVHQIIAGHLPRRLAKDREARKIFSVVRALKIERQ